MHVTNINSPVHAYAMICSIFEIVTVFVYIGDSLFHARALVQCMLTKFLFCGSGETLLSSSRRRWRRDSKISMATGTTTLAWMRQEMDQPSRTSQFIVNLHG